MKVHVVDHSPAWAKLFLKEAERISRALGACLTEIHHIGSTAVPRLAAKPIIDMMPVVRSLEEAEKKRELLEALGYEWCGELGIPGRRYLRKDDPCDPETRLFQLHVFDEKNTADIRRHLAVRDYLRAHGDAASEYGALKRKLAREHPTDIEAYCDGKDAFVKALEAKAVAWWEKRAEGLSIIPVRERPGIVKRAAAWFSSKWDIPADEYRTSMDACCTAGEGDAVPQWYVALDGGRIVAGAGVIENDFHTRPDLAPNVCAVYVEPAWRGLGIAGKLLDFVCRDMAGLGVARLFLLTDHEGLYERMGWRFREIVRDNDGAAGHMYEKETSAMAATRRTPKAR